MDSTIHETEQQFVKLIEDFATLRSQIRRVIVGQEEVIESTLSALLTGGHVLLEGLPGLGKTRIVRTIAEASRLTFQRIQFTPDLMPSDLIGTNILSETEDGRRQFSFQRGPIFANLLLADEINRATPRTQSALLEAMAEHHATVAGVMHKLPRPFFVLATQNPIEHEGTYPLPEAQLDRFLVKLIVGFPSHEELDQITIRTTDVEEPHAEPVIDAERLVEMSRLVRTIPISSEVRGYAIDLILSLHPDQTQAHERVKRYVRYGPSPRGLQALILLGKARAALCGRFHVAREDIQVSAPPALRHRLLLNFEGQADGIRSDAIIEKSIESLGKRGHVIVAKAKVATSKTPPNIVTKQTQEAGSDYSSPTVSFATSELGEFRKPSKP